MVCLDCGRQAAEFSSYCLDCRNYYRQYLAKTTFWSKFASKSGRYTRQYNFAPQPKRQRGFFPGRGLLRPLLFPGWAFRKILQLLR